MISYVVASQIITCWSAKCNYLRGKATTRSVVPSISIFRHGNPQKGFPFGRTDVPRVRVEEWKDAHGGRVKRNRRGGGKRMSSRSFFFFFFFIHYSRTGLTYGEAQKETEIKYITPPPLHRTHQKIPRARYMTSRFDGARPQRTLPSNPPSLESACPRHRHGPIHPLL